MASRGKLRGRLQSAGLVPHAVRNFQDYFESAKRVNFRWGAAGTEVS
jgi:hypothetical protein